MREDCSRVSGGEIRRFLCETMNAEPLSVFVDESGRFQHPDTDSRFYILGMVFHNQSFDISRLVREFDKSIQDLGLDPEAFVFHAGPLIRKEKGYEYFTRNMRGMVYDRMMTFARKVDFRYRCLCVDKKYINSSLQIVSRLRDQLDEFIKNFHGYLSKAGHVKVYYDCGQSPVTNLLHESFKNIGCTVEFAQGVVPRDYKLFQLADLICTLHLVETKRRLGVQLTESEYRFFGGLRAFKKNELRFLKRKLLV